MRTLLLNATYEPLAVVEARRAIVLVIADKAEVLENGDTVFHTVSSSYVCPRVIRLKYFVKIPYRSTIRLSRDALMRRDGEKCGYCGKKATTIDHIVPRSRGGKHHWENVVASCARCNTVKGDRLLQELHWELSIIPHAPKGHNRLVLGILEQDPIWDAYLEKVAI